MRCPRCSAENPAGMKFCGQCAAALTDPAPLSRPDGELKQVTVLFCDLVNSTGLAEQLGPEAMHDLVRGFIDRALDEVHRFGGTAPQFTGDGFLALFGAPVAHEDHVRRALLAALAIQQAIGADAPAGRPQVAVRIGIHTGLVVFGAVGARLNMDPTVIGDTANIAARLETAAEPGTIVISAETWRLAQGYARAQPIAPLVVKGKAEPIPAYRLVGYSDRRTALDAASASSIRDFVDRDSEFAALNRAAREAAGGSGRIIGLVGEPGIGKSRLLAEFRRGLADIDWVEGRCFSYGTGIPYGLALDLLRGRCGIADADPPDAVADKVRAGLHRAGLDAEEDAPLLLHLLGLLDVGGGGGNPDTEAQKLRTFEILRRLQVGGKGRQPLVLALEDLHWIDKLSEEFLVSLTELLPGNGILVVATYRTEYRPPWADRPGAGEVALLPLSAADSALVVNSVLGASPLAAPMTSAIVEKGDGNPFFLEQLALHAGEDAAPHAAGTVPNTIHDVVMARIDRLPDATKRLLQIAAVIGREFSHRLVAAVWPGPDPIEPHLEALIRLEFIHERPPGERPGYVFHHALTQETAYASLLERHRRRWHGRIATAIEGFYAGRVEDVAERLALNYGRGDDAEKAVDYAILAAEKSQRRWANSEALAYFEDALRRLDTMPGTPANRVRRIDAVLKQAEVRYALGQYTEHIDALAAIRAIIDDSGDPRRRATWHYWTGFLHSVTGGRPEIAIEHCRAAAAIASAHGLDDIDAVVASCLAQVYIVAGRLHDAVAAGERALASFEARGNLWWASRTLWFLGIAALYLGEWDEALGYYGRALDHGVALGDPRIKAVSWARIGAACVQQGDFDRGMRCFEEALAVAPTPRDAAWARAARGYGAIRAGCCAAGIAELAEALAWFASSRMRYSYLGFALWLAEGHLRGGNPAAARPLIEDVLTTSRRTGYLHYEGRASWLMGECLAAEAPAAAEDCIETALRIFAEVGARNDLARAMVSRAALRRQAGDIGTARDLLQQADAIFRALGTRDERHQVRALLLAVGQGARDG
jgi:class 3 adenylate cyclase/tetratricopeptide (TPR) repeat protein